MSPHHLYSLSFFFFFNDTATTEIYTLSLHDTLPIYHEIAVPRPAVEHPLPLTCLRSEEHTSELQSPCNLVCRLLLEKKKTKTKHRKIVNIQTSVDGREHNREVSRLCSVVLQGAQHRQMAATTIFVIFFFFFKNGPPPEFPPFPQPAPFPT